MGIKKQDALNLTEWIFNYKPFPVLRSAENSTFSTLFEATCKEVLFQLRDSRDLCTNGEISLDCGVVGRVAVVRTH